MRMKASRMARHSARSRILGEASQVKARRESATSQTLKQGADADAPATYTTCPIRQDVKAAEQQNSAALPRADPTSRAGSVREHNKSVMKSRMSVYDARFWNDLEIEERTRRWRENDEYEASWPSVQGQRNTNAIQWKN